MSYKGDTVRKIRELCPEFDSWEDQHITEFYHNWSEQTYCAGWIANGEEEFVEYATSRPIDTWRD